MRKEDYQRLYGGLFEDILMDLLKEEYCGLKLLFQKREDKNEPYEVPLFEFYDYMRKDIEYGGRINLALQAQAYNLDSDYRNIITNCLATQTMPAETEKLIKVVKKELETTLPDLHSGFARKEAPTPPDTTLIDSLQSIPTGEPEAETAEEVAEYGNGH